MEDLFNEVQCRSKSDSIVMEILRSAMDKAHERLHSNDRPIEFLHERSTFYELAAVLVEGGLNIVQEETDILENSCDKILSDLIEIKYWLQGRIKDMKQLIVDKDTELAERLENELKLRQILELKDRELLCLHEKLDRGQINHEDVHDLPITSQPFQDGAAEGDIIKLKTSVDQQMGYIKRKLEHEEKSLTPVRRIRKYYDSSPNLSFEFLDKERHGSPVFTENDSFGIGRSCKIKAKSESSTPDKNVLVRWMSSDINILKETLDHAFGRMQSAEVLPMETQWKWTIEKDIESILVKGYISNLQQGFGAELKERVGLLKDNWIDFIDEMRILCGDVKDFFTGNNLYKKRSHRQSPVNSLPMILQTASEPLPDIVEEESLLEEDTEVDGSHYAAKMTESNEYVIHRQRDQWNSMTGEVNQRGGLLRNKDNRLERRIQDVITRLDNLAERNNVLADQPGFSNRNGRKENKKLPKSHCNTNRSFTKVESLEKEIQKLKEERDDLVFQISVMEDTYQLLFRGMARDVCIVFSCEGTEKLVKHDDGGYPHNKFSYDQINHGMKDHRTADELETTLNQILPRYMESNIREGLYVILFRETVEQWKDYTEEHFMKEKRRQIASDDPIKCSLCTSIRVPNPPQKIRGPEISSDDSQFNSIFQETMGSLLQEDIFMVFSREMAEMWKSEKDACAIESLIREDIYGFIITEAVKDSYFHVMETESQRQLRFQDCTPHFVNFNADCFQESTPHSRKYETDGEESLIHKLDYLLKCLEAEEDLMLSASSEIMEHSVNNSLVILNCEETDERDAIKWLLTDDESTFSSVSEKLERALQQLYTSKELLVELEQGLEVSDNLEGNNNEAQLKNVMSFEREKTHSFLQQEDDQVRKVVPSDNVLAIVMQFQHVLGNVEQVLHENLASKCLRLEVLKGQVDKLTGPVALMRTRKLLYKKAFISRCHNQKLAETEVDLLGDQVESLLCLLERIYVVLKKNATVLSTYFEVHDILKLMKRELSNGMSCKHKS